MDATGWTDVQDALNDLDFPAEKEAVVAHAERSGGTETARHLLRALPLGTYRNISEIRSSVRLDPAADEGQTTDRKVRQDRSPHTRRIAEHLRDTES
jgi:hypothetical protein